SRQEIGEGPKDIPRQEPISGGHLLQGGVKYDATAVITSRQASIHQPHQRPMLLSPPRVTRRLQCLPRVTRPPAMSHVILINEDPRNVPRDLIRGSIRDLTSSSLSPHHYTKQEVYCLALGNDGFNFRRLTGTDNN
ncbi:hypothetical protein Pcinc_040970, partial [Petrolisthes cinctipes]